MSLLDPIHIYLYKILYRIVTTINPLETAKFGKLLVILTACMRMLQMVLLFDKIHLFHALLLFP